MTLRAAGWAFLAFLGLYLLTSGVDFYSSDGEVVYRTTRALVEERSLAIPCDESLPQGLAGADGRCYSTYGPGMPAAAIPLYLLGRAAQAGLPAVSAWDLTRFTCARLNQIVTALTCALLLLAGTRLFGSLRTGIGVAVVYGLATLAWPYSKFYFSEPLVALALAAAFYGLLKYGDGGGPGWLALAGIAWGFALLTRVTTVVTLPLFVGYAMFLAGRRRAAWTAAARDLGWMAAPVVVAAALYLGHNAARFGSPLDFGYPGETWATAPWMGLYGLLLSPGKSLFLFTPVLLLSPFALAGLFRRGARAEALLFSGLALAYLLLHMGWWTWHGGWSWGPRFLVPALPFLALPLPALWRSLAGRVATFALGAASLIPQILGVTVDFNRYMLLVNDESKILFWPQHSPLLGHAQLLAEGRELSLLLLDPGAAGMPPATAWVVALTGACLLALGAVGLWRAAVAPDSGA